MVAHDGWWWLIWWIWGILLQQQLNMATFQTETQSPRSTEVASECWLIGIKAGGTIPYKWTYVLLVHGRSKPVKVRRLTILRIGETNTAYGNFKIWAVHGGQFAATSDILQQECGLIRGWVSGTIDWLIMLWANTLHPSRTSPEKTKTSLLGCSPTRFLGG